MCRGPVAKLARHVIPGWHVEHLGMSELFSYIYWKCSPKKLKHTKSMMTEQILDHQNVENPKVNPTDEPLGLEFSVSVKGGGSGPSLEPELKRMTFRWNSQVLEMFGDVWFPIETKTSSHIHCISLATNFSWRQNYKTDEETEVWSLRGSFDPGVDFLPLYNSRHMLHQRPWQGDRLWLSTHDLMLAMTFWLRVRIYH